MAIGDWGYFDPWRAWDRRLGNGNNHGWSSDWRHEPRITTDRCQMLLAEEMKRTADELATSSKPLKFVINAGDSFYPAGVTSVQDEAWEDEWGKVYGGLPAGLNWYSVYGNHDYSQLNRACACQGDDAGDGPGSSDGGRTCAQVQKHGATHGGQRWYMPEMSYHVRPLEGINLEIVVLEMNGLQVCPHTLAN